MKLPEEMQDQVISFMHHKQNSPDLHQDLEQFYAILNEPLKKQILYHLHSPLLKKVPELNNCSSVEQAFFITNMKAVLFLPKDVILREGEKGDNIYFLNKGICQVELKGHDKKIDTIATLQDGAIFGEVALLTKLKRTATVRSDDYTNCAFLNKSDV